MSTPSPLIERASAGIFREPPNHNRRLHFVSEIGALEPLRQVCFADRRFKHGSIASASTD
jgi:hypothetical protein